MRIAYLCSKYPWISHTFVLREVEALRQAGLEIDTFAVRRTPPEALLAEADRREMETTYAILPARTTDVLSAFCRAFATRPRKFFATLAKAIRMNPGGVRGFVWQLFYLVEATVLWDQCRRRGTQRIHSHFANNAADIGLLAARLGGEGWRWSFTLHGSFELADVSHYRLASKVGEADLVICTSDFSRSQLMRFTGAEQWEKLHTVHCAVRPSQYRVVGGGQHDGQSFRILTVARLTPGKGVALLIEALASLVGLGLDAKLTIVGDGTDRTALASRAQSLGVSERVEFLGVLGQDALPQIYAAADVFCLPSFAEGIPVVLMEAMAAGLPVVATRIMGIPELVEHGVSGLLVAPARVDQLIEALALLAADPLARIRFGEQGRAMVEREFSSDVAALELRQLFEAQASGASATESVVRLEATTNA